MHLRLIFSLAALLLLPSAALSAPPTYSWGHGYGDDATQTLSAVAADRAGNVLLCGSFYSTITIATTLTSSGFSDAFVAKLDASGNALWDRKIGISTYNDAALDVTGDKDGNVVAVGSTQLTFGNDRSAIVKYDPGGTQLWLKTYGSSSMAECVATDVAGNIIVSGVFSGSIDFGGGPIEPPGFDSYGMFLVKLDPNGNHIWSKSFAWDYSGTSLGGVETDAMGNVVLHGQFVNAIDFGGGALASSGSSDLFLVKFRPDGSVIWNHRYGTAAIDNTVCLAVTTDGRAAIAENLDHTVDFGGGPLTPTGSPQPAVAVFNPDGSHSWSKTFIASTYGFAYGMTFGENNDLLLTCHASGGTLNFGGGAVSPVGTAYNVFVARLFGSSGAHRWSFAFGGDDNVYGFPAVAHGRVTIAGTMDGAANPGGGALPYGGESDVYATSFNETLTGVGVSSMMAVLGQNVPNPFNPTTSIPYMLEASTRVVIGVYDVAGSRVVALDEGMQSPGTHAAIWNGRDSANRSVPSGVYFYRFEGNPDATGSRKMVLLK